MTIEQLNLVNHTEARKILGVSKWTFDKLKAEHGLTPFVGKRFLRSDIDKLKQDLEGQSE